MTKSQRLTGLVLGMAGLPFPQLLARMLAGEHTPPAPPAGAAAAAQEGSVLYIENAAAAQNGTILEVM